MQNFMVFIFGILVELFQNFLWDLLCNLAIITLVAIFSMQIIFQKSNIRNWDYCNDPFPCIFISESYSGLCFEVQGTLWAVFKTILASRADHGSQPTQNFFSADENNFATYRKKLMKVRTDII